MFSVTQKAPVHAVGRGRKGCKDQMSAGLVTARRGFDHGAGTDAAGAHVQSADTPVRGLVAHRLEVRLEPALGLDVGMADIVSCLGHFTAAVALVVALACAFGFVISGHAVLPKKSAARRHSRHTGRFHRNGAYDRVVKAGETHTRLGKKRQPFIFRKQRIT